ncbi:MAG: alpha amylase C-terminal domain-containing protein [Kiritimatiellae bacterium]|nr:alpha amylase C-terminal domain-containing protein [Kiritimatiellia bacterium]
MRDMKKPHLLDDPCLAPYAEAVLGRKRRADDLAARLAGSADARALADWASAHEYYGLHRVERGWVFREFAPNATAVSLVGDFSGWALEPRFALRRIDAEGTWEGRFPASAFRHGQFYRLEMAWPGGRGERIPAYARRVVQDAQTNLFAAQVWAPEPYVWRNAPPRAAKRPRIYEAHAGMALEEPRVGTYAEFRDRMLPRIKAAGYDVVQLMAVMEHPYYGSFGYHVSSFFAASSRFGTPEDLKSLVDAAHGMGLRVIMDLVHSHAVKNERDGLSAFDGTEHLYFHAGAKGRHRAWDSRCFDYGKTNVLHFLLSNCRFWLDEYRFDGFRFDGVTSMLYWDHGLGTAFTDYAMYFNGSVDDDAWAYLALANRVIHAVRPDALAIAEDVSGLPGCAAPPEDGGLGFDFRMAMGEPDYWFRLAEKTPDEAWAPSSIYRALTDKRAEERVVSYVESHDQALVGGKSFLFQLADSALYDAMRVDQSNPAIDRAVALHKMARLATYALSGGAYLAFMGNEFGHPEWIDFPRAENGWSFAHARRQWSLRDDPSLKFRGLGDFDAAMTHLRGTMSSIEEAGANGDRPVLLAAHDADQVLAFIRGDLFFAFNFSPVRSYADYGVMVPPGAYERVLDTDEVRFAGQGRIAPKQRYVPLLTRSGDELVQQIKLYLPARTALVARRVR